jgi:predicted dehydrogenase
MSVKVGIIGCGVISEIYLSNLSKLAGIEVAAVADANMENARVRSEVFGIPARSVGALLSDPEIEIVLNLTIPKAHAEVAAAVLNAGKHVYNEKPLAIERAEAREMLELAAAKGLRVGCAPDTFLGAALQTCRRLIDDGAIGEPVGAVAFMTCRGHERWHPNPDFYYQRGGGPMFDMGPYYLTALVALIGPVQRVTGSARITFPERTITSPHRFGGKIPVEVPTNIATVADFANGAVATMIMSFDVWESSLPHIEIFGSEGTLGIPDPNKFEGPVRLWHRETRGWREMPLVSPFVENWRGLGVADLAQALGTGRPHRASGELAWHVLDVMHAAQEAPEEGRHVELNTRCERPEPLRAGEIEVVESGSMRSKS